MRRSITLIVDAADAGLRVDVVLGRRISGLSRRAARALGLRGRIRVEDERSPPARVVRTGDCVVIDVGQAEPEALALVVLSTTDDFVYVDKPTGIHTHRLGPDEPSSLADAVATRFPECAGASEDVREGGAIARLDRETSGVVAFARSPAAWRRGRDAMVDPRARKHYLAVARGVPATPWPPALREAARVADEPRWWEAEAWQALPQPQSVVPVRLTLELGRGTDRGRVAVRFDGRTSHTVVTPLATHPRACTLFAVALGRGFRHQIRVALAWLGLPIAGDSRYGATDDDARLMLHCAELDLSACCAGEQRVAALLDPARGIAPDHLAALLHDPTWRPWASSDGA